MIDSNSLKYSLRDKKFVIFDTETSCLNLGLQYNRAWQLSWLVAQGKQIQKEYNCFLKWDNFYISPGAAQVTKFDPRVIEVKGLDPKAVLKEFDSYLYNPEYIILGQNVLNFDVYVLNMYRESYGLPTDYSYINRIIDIRALAVCYKLGVKFKQEENFLAQQYRFLSYRKKGFKTNLAALAKELNISVDENSLHDALADIKLTFDVFLELVRLLEI